MVSVPQDSQDYISRRVIMQRISILLLALVVCFATAMQAQAPAPKPDPEVKKLHVLVGHWTIEGEFKPGPLGPGGKWTGVDNCRMILGGFFFQCQLSGKVAESEVRLLEIDGYDPVNKNFSSRLYIGDGSTFSGVSTVTGNTWTWTGKWTAAGKEYQYKEAFILSPDLTGATNRSEISVDGKTWVPFGESKWTKAKPAAKK
jgi:hypothetical protein